MPIISPDDNYLTVINLFLTDTPDRQEHLLGAMREIVDSAAFPGWISSTVHSGQQRMGTANFIQWRSKEDLEARYAEDVFKHRTMPLFTEITTSIRLLQTRVVAAQRHPSQGDSTEISPLRDDYTVIEILGVDPERQDDLVDTLAGQPWLVDTPGYRSNAVLKGIGARGLDGAFVVHYSQWADKAAYDAFRAVPEFEQAPARQRVSARLDALIATNDWNSYRIVHSRSAADALPAGAAG